MNSSESSEEDSFDNYHLEYWKDWRPSLNLSDASMNSKSSHCSKNIYLKNDRGASISTMVENHKFGNWIPPANFLNSNLVGKKIVLQNTEEKNKNINKMVDSNENKKTYIPIQGLEKESNIKWEEKLNLDWGKRVELHDVTNYNDGDLLWGYVNLGLFSSIKLWINEYGNICGLAEGTVSKIGSFEATVVLITNTQLLQKMLRVSSAQWACLCEVLLQTKASLKFEALVDCDLMSNTYLEKLWFFICKRRHFLPDQCMLVKLSGAVKSFRQLKITPKLIVQDIRDIQGQPVS